MFLLGTSLIEDERNRRLRRADENDIIKILNERRGTVLSGEFATYYNVFIVDYSNYKQIERYVGDIHNYDSRNKSMEEAKAMIFTFADFDYELVEVFFKDEREETTVDFKSLKDKKKIESEDIVKALVNTKPI